VTRKTHAKGMIQSSKGGGGFTHGTWIKEEKLVKLKQMARQDPREGKTGNSETVAKKRKTEKQSCRGKRNARPKTGVNNLSGEERRRDDQKKNSERQGQQRGEKKKQNRKFKKRKGRGAKNLKQ